MEGVKNRFQFGLKMNAIILTETCLRTSPKFGLIYAQSESREKEEEKEEPHLKMSIENERKRQRKEGEELKAIRQNNN
jgi:hypothetical protein